MQAFPAPAKINLHLHVGGILPDGRHALDTSFAFVDIADTLAIAPAPSVEVSCSRPHLSGPANLVHRVLTALAAEHGVTQGLKVHIDKHLPEQGGLGGGSSDAATALWVANRLWGLGMPVDALIRFAVPMGADIPCFLFGEASLAHGVGEHLSPYPSPLPQTPVVLAHPGEGLSTAEVFRRFDALHNPPMADTIATRSGRAIAVGDNDLEAVACDMSPGLSRLLAAMRGQASAAWMSGSGSTCVALVDDAEAGRALAAALRDRGLATWTHVGRIERYHPLRDVHWGVAKR
ncbi:MAG TPA: 4-(cytidine 5'-diphospho)-2-C-methyl-D-erythritol kinase [Mariprofundaceae bacterium]|nr:4-(cytidine 5'-diphospho)-2-C-methyl-D-erythritol kinase [Mariprofundaceae bacterium]